MKKTATTPFLHRLKARSTGGKKTSNLSGAQHKDHLSYVREGLAAILSFFSCNVFIGGHLYFFGGVTGPFMIALLIAMVFAPPLWQTCCTLTPFSWRQDISKVKKIYVTAVFLLTAILCFSFTTFMLHVIPFLKHHVRFLGDHVMRHAGPLAANFEAFLEHLGGHTYTPAALTQALNAAAQWFIGTFHHAFDTSAEIDVALLYITLTPLLTFFLLRDWPTFSWKSGTEDRQNMLSKLHTTLATLGPRIHMLFTRHVLCCVAAGVMHAAVLWSCSAPYPGTLGALHGMLLFIPYLGFGCSFLITLAVLLQHAHADFFWWMALGTFTFSFLCTHFFIRSPKQKLCPPLLQIAMLLVTALLLGPLGLFLTLPLAVISVVISKWLWPHNASSSPRKKEPSTLDNVI